MNCEFQWCFLVHVTPKEGTCTFGRISAGWETKTTQKNGSVQSEEAGYINPVFSDAECKSGAATELWPFRCTNTRHLQAQSESWCHISHFLRQFQSIHVNSDMSTKSTIIFSMFLIPAIRSITFLQLIWKIIRKFPPKHSWQKFQLSAGHWSEHSCTSVPSSSSLQLRGAPIGSCTRGGCDMQVGESWKCGEINWYNRIDSCILLWFFHSVTFPFRLSLYWLLILKSPQFGNL